MKQEKKTDNRTEKRKIGDIGENIACRFLMKRGLEIMERNYLKKWGEIDIIAKKGEKLHFIEVKSVTRSLSLNVSCETDDYRPEDNIHPWKLKRLSRVIQTYLLGYRPAFAKSYSEVNWQFDVITVYLDLKTRQAKVNWIEDVIL
jgi:putative endonuclease